ncbi:unnamed protein product [Hymenolepis diminuta]|uniref:DNA primase n=2 Tax=Hymenolepis diminuta TaxID=6216 RepID=A0A0R3SAI2_HYMDI|nr:unnamed protein product [Hymenolepis diminuta]
MEFTGDFDRYLKIFYRKLFPCELVCKWLSCGSKQMSEVLSRREFSFTLPGDVYVRYQSFNDSASFRKELIKSCPHKIDIGAVYSAPPKLQRSLSSVAFTPEWKELVFDIDLTDYDEIRFCCGAQNPDAKAPICEKCWELAKCAVICMDRALREDFGLEHILWVYSGRRGVHCWVCDPVARQLDSVGRTAIVEYLTLAHGGEARKSKKAAQLVDQPLHPSIESAASLLCPRFSNYCISQDMLNSCYPERIKWVLKHLPADMTLQRNKLTDQWTSDSSDNSSTAKRWNTLKLFLQEVRRNNIIKDIVLNTLYPRLDSNVSTGTGHLLKSPFCVHPKTGFVCVPFDAQNIEEFNPLTVPSLTSLVEQISRTTSGTEEPTGQHLLAYKGTALRPYIEFFENFINRLSASTEVSNVDNKLPLQDVVNLS